MTSPQESESRVRLADRIARSLPELGRYVRARLGTEMRSKESASDIVQSTARELLQGRAFEDLGDEAFQRWLHTAAENKIRKRARYWNSAGRERVQRLGERTAVDPRKESLRPSEDAMLTEERERLERAVATLTPEYRLVLQRVQMEGASYAQVGRELGRSSEAVRKLAARALARLGAALCHE